MQRTQAPPFKFELDMRSGVPVYRQLIDQVLVAVASSALGPGDQLPTVRQLAVDLSINPNTVGRAYKELEIRGMLSTQQGTGTFITSKKVEKDGLERSRRLTQIVTEFVARAGAEGYSLEDIQARLSDMTSERQTKEK